MEYPLIQHCVMRRKHLEILLKIGLMFWLIMKVTMKRLISETNLVIIAASSTTANLYFVCEYAVFSVVSGTKYTNNNNNF